MIHVGEQSGPLVQFDSAVHTHCALRAALSLIAGRSISISRRAYPGARPSPIARFLQYLHGAGELALSIGREKTIIYGENLAYLGGDIEYFSEHIFRRWWSLLNVKRPFFVFTGTAPGRSIAAATGCDLQPAPKLCLTDRCTVVIMAHWAGIPSVLHYAPCEISAQELARQAQGLGIASKDPEFQALLPRMLAHAVLENGCALLAQARIPAEPYQFSWERVDSATELWVSRKPAIAPAGKAWIARRIDQVCEALPTCRHQLLPPLNALLRWCESAATPTGVTHGDLWLGNVLFSASRVSGVIDWEWAQADGFIQADCLHMLLMSLAVNNDIHIAHYLRQLWLDEIGDSALQNRIATLRARSGMDLDALKFLALALWLNLIWQKAMRNQSYAAAWFEEMIPRTIPAITKWLSRHMQ